MHPQKQEELILEEGKHIYPASTNRQMHSRTGEAFVVIGYSLNKESISVFLKATEVHRSPCIKHIYLSFTENVSIIQI